MSEDTFSKIRYKRFHLRNRHLLLELLSSKYYDYFENDLAYKSFFNFAIRSHILYELCILDGTLMDHLSVFNHLKASLDKYLSDFQDFFYQNLKDSKKAINE
jgi:hypothetical protein